MKNSSFKDQLWNLLPFFLLVSASFIAYSRSFSVPLIFDDIPMIAENPSIRKFWPIWDAMKTHHETAAAGRPLVNLTFALNYAISGFQLQGYHLINLLFHCASLCLLYIILSKSFPTRNPQRINGMALLITLIFALHPLQSEAVIYLSQRTELMVGFFYLATLFCFIRSLEHPEKTKLWASLAVIASACGMASKEVMVLCPILILLYDRAYYGSSFKEIFSNRKVFYISLFLTWLVLAGLLATAPRSGSTGFHYAELSALDYFRTQTTIIVHYLKLCFWPSDLVIDYSDWPIARNLASWILPVLFLTVLFVGSIVSWKRHARLAFWGIWFFLILAPSSSFYPILTELAAERRMYLPFISVLIVIALLIDWILRKTFSHLPFKSAQRPVKWGFGICLVVLLTFLTYQRSFAYDTHAGIWKDTVDKRPENKRAYYNLGKILQEEGKYDEALSNYSKALEVGSGVRNPYEHTDEKTHNNLGNLYLKLDNFSEAKRHYILAIEINPKYAKSYYNLANILHGEGKLEEAIGFYQTAIRLRPRYPQALNNLGISYLRQKHYELAIETFLKAIASPSMHIIQAYSNLAVAYEAIGEGEKARKAASFALQFDPDNERIKRILAQIDK